MEEALRAWLLARAALASRVGTRIDWETRSQGSTMPALVLHLISSVPQTNLAGPSGWVRARVQIDSWGRTHKAARDVADIIAVPAANGGLHTLRETLADIKFRIFVTSKVSDTDSDEVGVAHRTRLDLTIWHTA